MTIVVFHEGTLYSDTKMLNNNVSVSTTLYNKNKIVSSHKLKTAYAYSGKQPDKVTSGVIMLYLYISIELSQLETQSLEMQLRKESTEEIDNKIKISKESLDSILMSMKKEDFPLFIGGNDEYIFAKIDNDVKPCAMDYCDTLCIGSDATMVYTLIKSGYSPAQAIRKVATVSPYITSESYKLNLKEL